VTTTLLGTLADNNTERLDNQAAITLLKEGITPSKYSLNTTWHKKGAEIMSYGSSTSDAKITSLQMKEKMNADWDAGVQNDIDTTKKAAEGQQTAATICNTTATVCDACSGIPYVGAGFAAVGTGCKVAGTGLTVSSQATNAAAKVKEGDAAGAIGAGAGAVTTGVSAGKEMADSSSSAGETGSTSAQVQVEAQSTTVTQAAA